MDRKITTPKHLDYVEADVRIVWRMTGFTNPPTSDPQSFHWTSYSQQIVTNLGQISYMIDQTTDMILSAQQGECSIDEMYPTDNDYIYGVPTNYTIKMTCDHLVLTDYGLQLIFPDDW